ncbi:MAG: hypothetical protein ACKOYQ_02260 [Actinomycetota bacterium]
MQRSRVAALGAAAVLALSLGLSACGGSSSGGDTGGDSAAKQQLIDELVGELESGGAVPPDQVACIKQGFNDFSVEELTVLRDSEADTEVPTELQDKILNLITGCVLGESASPAAS